METEEAVIITVADEFNLLPERLSADVQLTNELGFDSIDRLGLAVCLEKRFHIELADRSVNRLKTIGDVVDLVELKTTLLCKAINAS